MYDFGVLVCSSCCGVTLLQLLREDLEAVAMLLKSFEQKDFELY
jgi:hypothetical protein